jgi:hypothetical protein
VLRVAPPDMDVHEVRAILQEVAGPQGQEDLVNAAEQLIEQGREQGRAEGVRTALLDMIAARGLQLSELGSNRVASCTDTGALRRWLVRAATASSEAEVFAGDPTA